MAIETLPSAADVKAAFDIDRAGRSDAALKQILVALFEAMMSNYAGIFADRDSEYLHDFRVAMRRSRTVLGQFKQVLPRREVERFGRVFAWLSEITSPVRDLDVYLAAFAAYQAAVPLKLQAALEPLGEFLAQRRRIEHARLIKALRSRRYQRFAALWHEFLLAPAPVRSRLKNAARSIQAVADERIRKVWRQVMREGRAISAASPEEQVHALRKRCKKLRYLIEFFVELYPPKKIATLIKALKRLQENLGTYQDLHVQAAALRGFDAQMIRVPPVTHAAMDRLVRDLARRQLQAREEFARCFARFDTKGNRALARRLFAEGGDRG